MSVPHSPRQRLDGTVPVLIGGIEHRLRFTMESMAALETAESRGNLDHLLAMLWAMLLPLHPGTDINVLEDSLDYGDIKPVSDAVSRCLRLCLPREKKQASSEPKRKSKTNWARLWAYAHQDLRLSWDEFWSLTPKLYAALSERHQERLPDTLYGYAMVCSTIANAHRDAKKKPDPFTADDFLPARGERRQQAQPAAVRDLRQRSREIFQAYGERTVRVKPTLPFLVKTNG